MYILIETPVTTGHSGDSHAWCDAEIEAFGGLHIGVNCAGMSLGGVPLADLPEDKFGAIVAINRAPGSACANKFPRSERAEAGDRQCRVDDGLDRQPDGPGLYRRSMASSASPRRPPWTIRAKAFGSTRCSGGTDTPMITDEIKKALVALHAIGRISQPDEVAAAILFLVSPAASFISGVALPVDGGWMTH